MIEYTTAAGSKVTVGLIVGAAIEFDWFEEPDACIECQAEFNPDKMQLFWLCHFCGGGRADLVEVINK